MMKTRKLYLSVPAFLMALLLALSFISAANMIFAENRASATIKEDIFTYLDVDGSTKTVDVFVPITANTTIWGPTDDVVEGEKIQWDENGKAFIWFVVEGDVTISSRVEILSNVRLLLTDGATLTLEKGVEVSNSSAYLTIYAQSTSENTMGKLIANSSNGSAAIGTTDGYGCQPIVINGGNIVASSSGSGAAIGGGYSYQYAGGNADVTINGGIVTATAADGAAAIGSAMCNSSHTSSESKIVINGGTVTATAESGAAAIGAGYYNRRFGSIRITGGNVTAITTAQTAIGCSSYREPYETVYGEIHITGGTVRASARFVGVGYYSHSNMTRVTVTVLTDDLETFGETETPVRAMTSLIYDGESEILLNCDKNKEYSLPCDYTIPNGVTLSIPQGTFVIPAGVTLTNNGTISNSGTIRVEGKLVNNGSVYNGTFTNNGTLVCGASSDVHPVYENGFCTNCGAYQAAVKTEAKYDVNGDGTLNETVYEINNAGNLFWFAELVNSGTKNANAMLTADLDLAGETWTPIASTASYHVSAVTDIGYTGIFDGGNHVVRNFTAECLSGDGTSGDSGNVKSYGLFGTVSGTVKNLGVDNFSFDSTAEGKADCRAGGIVGQVLTGGKIQNCYTINSKILTGTRIAGGIAGCNYGGLIENCFAYGNTVTGHSRCAAIVGDTVTDSGAPAKLIGSVNNCYADANPVGSQNGGTAYVINCSAMDAAQFASGEVAYKLGAAWGQEIGTDSYPVLGGTRVYVFTCKTIYSNDASDSNGHNAVTFTYSHIGAADGKGTHTRYYSCCGVVAAEAEDCQDVNGVCTLCKGMNCAHTVYDNGFCAVCGEYQLPGGSGTAEDPYTISNAGQLYWFAAKVNGERSLEQNRAAHAILTADIVVNTGDIAGCNGTMGESWRVWTPIGRSGVVYSGVFDGRNHTISGLYINDRQTYNVGVFGKTENAAIQNLGVTNSYFYGYYSVGGIVGSGTSTTVKNCYHIGTVSGRGWSLAGIMGVGTYATITNCYHVGTIQGTSDVSSDNIGGILGWNYNRSTITNSYYEVGCAVDGKGVLQLGIGTNDIGKVGTDNGTAGKTLTSFASGEVTYLLNGDQTNIVWYQTCGTGYPALSGKQVYTGYDNCGLDQLGYTNTVGALTEKPDHTIAPNSYSDNEDGTHSAYCTTCKFTIPGVHAIHNGTTGKCICGYQYGLFVERVVDYDGDVCEESAWFDNMTDALSYAVTASADSSYVTDSAVIHLYRNLAIGESESFTIPARVALDCGSYAVSNGGVLVLGGHTYETIPAAITGGKVTVENKTYTWDSASSKWLCDATSHTPGSYSASGNVITQSCSVCGAAVGTATVTAEGGTYNGEVYANASVEATGTLAETAFAVTYCCADGCKNAGVHTATITLDSLSASATFTIEKKELTLKLTDCSKEYDGTRELTNFYAEVEGVILYDEGSYIMPDIFDYDDIHDDVTVDSEKLIVMLPSSAVGTYSTASVSGITLTGEDAGNYTIAETVEEVPIQGYYDEFEIYTTSINITSSDQNLAQGSTLDQSAYTVEGLPTGHTVSGVVLEKDGTTILVVADAVVITDAQGNDVTAYFDIDTLNSGVVVEICANHSFNADGFCATGECNVYQAATRKDNGTEDSWDDYYEISNPGQLYWFAQQVNDYGKTYIGAVLTADIVIPESAPDWTPINGLYADFDGNYHTVSGLYVKSENDYIGMFGSSGYYAIKNLFITNSYFEGSDSVGAIAGYNQGAIENCGVGENVTVAGSSSAGLLVGYNTGNILNCFAYGSSVQGYMSNGYGSIENCYFLSDTEDDYDGTTAMTAAQFSSGEVAYLLQTGIYEEDIYDDDGNWIGSHTPEVWGQAIGKDEYPVLNGAMVYMVTDCSDNTVYSNTNVNGKHSNVTEWDWYNKDSHSCFCYTCAQDLFEEHGYVDGICSVCGGEDPEYVAPVELFKLSGANVVLGNDLTMNFALLSSNLNGTDYYAEIVKYNPDGTTVTTTYPFSSWTPYANGMMYLITLDGLVAKQMSDKVEVTVYTGDGVQASYTWEDSIRDYAIRQLNTTSNTAKVFTVLADMLNYGAAAQVQFKYNTSDLANATMTDTHKSYATASLDFSQYTNNQVVGDNFFGTILALETNIKMGVFFKGTGYENYTAKVSYRDHNGNAVSYEVAGADFDATYAAGGMYGIMVDTLVAGDVYQVVTVEVYDGSTLVASVSESMESYVVRQSASLLPIYDALMKFMVSSYNYSH